MIFGECPYDDCDELIIVAMPKVGGGFVDVECPKCKKSLYAFCSRVQSFYITKEQFELEYDIIDGKVKAKNITENSPAIKILRKAIPEMIARSIIEGNEKIN